MRRSSFTLCFLLLALDARSEPLPPPKIIERYKQMLSANPAEGTALDRLWQIYLDQGKAAELIQEYRGAGTFASEMVLGHLLHKAGLDKDSAEAYQRAAKLEAKSPLPLLGLARLKEAEGRAQSAAGFYAKAVPLLAPDDPRLPETLLQLGSAWLSTGDAAKATEAWERVAELRPEDLDLRRRLADAYEKNFLTAQAIAHLEYLEAHASAAERAPALQRLARLHQGAGRQDAAIAALEKALALTSPENWLRPELESQLIRLHQRYHRTAELEERWKAFASENPRDIGACLQLVGLYERLGDLEAQRAWLEKLAQLAPKNADHRLKLARLLTRMDATDAAAAIYDVLLKAQPANPDFVFERAKIDMLREAAQSARQRIAALLAARKDDESVRARALEFYEQNHLTDLVEAHLSADAAGGSDEAVGALAKFYFSQHREAEAQRALGRLVHPDAPPEKQAAAHSQIAQIFKGQNDLEKAAAELREAIRLRPGAREYHLALGELHTAQGDHAGAQRDFERVARLSKTEQERSEADQKLFESFRAQGAALSAQGGGRPSPLAVPGVDSGLPEPNPALDEYLSTMAEEALHEPSEERWLRVARWRLWNHDLKGALAGVNAALDINPKSLEARELLVKLDSTNGPSARAVQDLQKLAELDPANQAAYQRRAGQLELQAGRIVEALELFRRLSSANPGNLDALTDLALTQQRADRWTDALARWRQVYALSPASRKKDALVPLLRALEKLDLHPQAADFQLRALDGAPNDRERLALFGDLLAYCTKHNLLDWLRTQFEKRRQLRADDYFTEISLGRILKASGNVAAAFELLADASYAAPNQAEALPELIREAEELHKPDAAARLQAQLIRIVPQENADGLEKLAQLQEKNFQIEDAAATWDRVAAKFPRDAAAHNRAVEFQINWGSDARAIILLRKARALDPANLRMIGTLAELDLEAGNTAEAEACLEQILGATASEKAGEPMRFPALKSADAGRLQTAYLATVGQRNARPSTEAMKALRGFWVEEKTDPKSDRDFRLNAIRQRAQLLQAQPGSPARAAWIERWSREPEKPSEALWALYYAGAGEAALDRLEAILAGNARNTQAAQAFVWLALQTRQYARVGAWLRDKRRTPTERDYLFIALGQLLDASGGQVDKELIDSLFAEGTHLRLWQAAMLFAGRNRFREAAQLGQRVFDHAATQRAAYSEELAHWHLLLDAPERALAVLRTAIQSPADSFEAPVCAALRTYYLLLPEKERPGFVENYLVRIDGGRQPLHAAIAGALLHGLSGDQKAASDDLAKLLEMRVLAALDLDESGNAAVRRWRFLLTAGIQLQAWKLDGLAIELWERALADQALVQLQGDQIANAARDLRQRLCVLHTAAAPSGELQQWIDSFARLAPHDGAAPLAAALGAMGANARAIEIYRQLWERDHGEPEVLRNLLNTCRAAGDDDTAEAVLASTVKEGALPLNESVRREFMLQFADLLDRRGEIERARTMLAEALRTAPGDLRLLQRLGQMHEKAGQPERAGATYRQLLAFEPGNIAVRLALSAILENQKRLPEAIALLQAGPAPETEARLALLQIRSRQPEEALAALERIPPPQQIAPVLQAVDAFAEKKDLAHARMALQAALTRSADPRMSFPLECKVIELLEPDEGPAVARRELRRLRRMAGNVPGLLASYLDFASRQCGRLHLAEEFAQELNNLWAEGKGPVPAGLALLNAQLAVHDRTAAAGTIERLLGRDDAGDAALQVAADALEKAQLPEWLAPVQERMARINPVNEQNALNLARTLRQIGRHEAARATLEPLAYRAALSDELAGRVAAGFAEAGDPERAAALYAQAVHGDPYARNYSTWVQYAQLQTRGGGLAAAKKTLRAAFGNPANRNFEPIIEWIVAAGRLEAFDAEAIDFGLTPSRVTELRRALFGYFEKAEQFSNAAALVEAHPEILQSGMAATLRSLAVRAHAFSGGEALFEKLAAQGVAEASPALAQLYGDWAASEISAQPDAALAHLRKAHEQHPELAEIAIRLSALQSERGDRRAAIETLESFLAVGRNAGEIEKARAQLAKLKSGS